MKFPKLAAIAALGVTLSATAALAAPAVVVTQLNVRDGPGTRYDVVDVLYRGDIVDVERCKGSWCYVDKRGPNGWVSAKYLARGDRHYDYDDDVDFDFSIIIGGGQRHYPQPDPYEPPITRYPTLNPDGSPMGGNVCYEGPYGLECY